MFTDGPTTPLRVETLLTLVRGLARRISRETLRAVFQPEGVAGKGDSPFVQTLKAVAELKLVQEKDGDVSAIPDGGRLVRESVQEALDREVLAHTEVEPYFALFYAFVLGIPGSSMGNRKRDEWAAEFNRVVFAGGPVSNPFNPVKLTGLERWLRYAGLGWYDSKEVFQCLPVPRLLRRLDKIFGGKQRLTGEEFMAGLARECSELDGGELFLKANPGWDPSKNQCTTGVAQALVVLHEEGWLRLHCAPDSRGWSIESATPPNDGKTLRSARLDEVEFVRSLREAR
jgi:hypothetical protein